VVVVDERYSKNEQTTKIESTKKKESMGGRGMNNQIRKMMG